MSTISFCSLDPKNKKLFAFINKKKKRNFCHVFQCHEGDVSQYNHELFQRYDYRLFFMQAQKMVETMAEAFEVTFKLLEQEKKRKEVNLTLFLKRDTFLQNNFDQTDIFNCPPFHHVQVPNEVWYP